MIKASLFIALFAWITSPSLAFAAKTTHCLVVKGDSPSKDPKGVFKGHPLLNPDTRFYGQKCYLFESWFDLHNYYQEELSSLPSEDHQIFAAQLAHGSNEVVWGRFVCNAHTVEMPLISAALARISQKHQVFFLNDGCYSGNQLLMEIHIQKDLERAKRVCVVTTSVVNSYSFKTLNVFAGLDSNPLSAEEYFSRNFEDGLISSAVFRRIPGESSLAILSRLNPNPVLVRPIDSSEEDGAFVTAIKTPTPLGPVLVSLEQDAFGQALGIGTSSWSPAHNEEYSQNRSPQALSELFGRTFEAWFSRIQNETWHTEMTMPRLYPTIAAKRSLTLLDDELSPLDLARREACRSFILAKTPPLEIEQLEEAKPWWRFW